MTGLWESDKLSYSHYVFCLVPKPIVTQLNIPGIAAIQPASGCNKMQLERAPKSGKGTNSPKCRFRAAGQESSTRENSSNVGCQILSLSEAFGQLCCRSCWKTQIFQWLVGKWSSFCLLDIWIFLHPIIFNWGQTKLFSTEEGPNRHDRFRVQDNARPCKCCLLMHLYFPVFDVSYEENKAHLIPHLDRRRV